ncbi:predicted protein [Arabidopsis lyrata subsp. lyrata]|uniref:Predicted protein n=1 Tax=Arabidopsis lyrata subsp. lyrata TaxID=81972 RepID=D7KH97_ARALL|nr:predicted protein [Arabidopsis lyrata subsp. lyrata]
MVELKLATGRFEAMLPDEDVSLPSLKTLFLERICFYNTDFCVLGKLLFASPLLEEFTIRCVGSWQYGSCCRNVSSSTLKKLTIVSTPQLDFWDMLFDTPNLAYLEYTGLVPREYPTVNLESLVEAKLDLSFCLGISNPTNLIKGLTNVEVLELSSVKTSEGPLHADECEGEYGLSCPVKVLKITEYGGKSGELKRMKHLLEKLACLELVKVRACAINDKEKSRITKDLLMVPRSFNCNIQLSKVFN